MFVVKQGADTLSTHTNLIDAEYQIQIFVLNNGLAEEDMAIETVE